MKKFFAVLLLMLVAFSANVTMAQEMPPIPMDPDVRIGKLDCGLTYYIRNNNYPENRVNFYIAQRVWFSDTVRTCLIQRPHGSLSQDRP